MCLHLQCKCEFSQEMLDDPAAPPSGRITSFGPLFFCIIIIYLNISNNIILFPEKKKHYYYIIKLLQCHFPKVPFFLVFKLFINMPYMQVKSDHIAVFKNYSELETQHAGKTDLFSIFKFLHLHTVHEMTLNIS